MVKTEYGYEPSDEQIKDFKLLGEKSIVKLKNIRAEVLEAKNDSERKTFYESLDDLSDGNRKEFNSIFITEELKSKLRKEEGLQKSKKFYTIYKEYENGLNRLSTYFSEEETRISIEKGYLKSVEEFQTAITDSKKYLEDAFKKYQKVQSIFSKEIINVEEYEEGKKRIIESVSNIRKILPRLKQAFNLN